jgi:hypothetical protein
VLIAPARQKAAARSGEPSKMRQYSPNLIRILTLSLFSLLLAAANSAAQVVSVSDSASLQTALNTVPEGGVVELAGGTYSAPAGGWTIYPDHNGGTRGFTVRAAPGASVTLSGNGNSRILTFTTPKLVSFERLTFSNGLSVEDYHGALSLAGVQASFVQCTFANNAANPPVTGGGALWIDTSTVSFQGCIFSNNSSKNYAGAFSAYLSRVFVRDCRFSGNHTNVPGHSSFNAGGAIHGNSSTMQINSSLFENNQAGYVGGALYVIAPFTDPTMDLLVTDCLFTGNAAAQNPSGAGPPGPTTGGAIMMENKTQARFYNCRFTNNSARQGGALSSYRSTTEVKNSVFRNNQATGTGGSDGFGGAIIVLSDDNSDASTNSGNINRPSASLSLTDCLVQGPGGGAATARQGGGIFVGGDSHAMFGIGVKPNGTVDQNRTTVTLKRVAFANLATFDSNNGTGGALTGDFVNLTADSCIVENCSASQFGGGFELVRGSAATITNTTFSHNSAGVLGGALTMFGGDLNLKDSNLTDNQLTNPGGGSALMFSADTGGGPYGAWDMTGAVENCIISNNFGGPATIYDGYRASAPVNRLQYKSNHIYPSDTSAFFFDTIGTRSVADVNQLSVNFGGASLAKGIANTALTGPAAAIGAILMVPQTAFSSGAPGESLPLPAYLAYASSGGAATVDGTLMRNTTDVLQTTENKAHTLLVANTTYATTPPAGSALNISTRLPVGTGQQVLIAGFIIQGPSPKTVMLRGIGPSLPLAGFLQNPFLELHDNTGQIVARNDNWRSTNIGGLLASSQVVDLLTSGISPSNPVESALIATVNPGAYTAVIRGADNGTGIAVVEGYDLDADSQSKLANISTRGFVQAGNDVMIGGFFMGGGPGQTTVVVRGIGPSLGAFGIANPLADPMLELHDGNGALIVSNDNWKSNQSAIEATGLQPSQDAEAAITLSNLAAGGYTAILQGKNGGVGVGVLEVYVY